MVYVSKAKKEAEAKRYFNPATLKPYNRFNLFFILERELVLQSNPDYKPSSADPRPFVTGYEDVEIPSSLPSRYANITIPERWYLPGRNKARSHTKSKNLIPFAELSKMIARNYKNVDEETFNYLDAISKSLLKRRKELKAYYANAHKHTAADGLQMNMTPSTASLQEPLSGSQNSNAHCALQVPLSNRTEDEVARSNHLKSLPFIAQLTQLLPQMGSAMQQNDVGLNQQSLPSMPIIGVNSSQTLTYADYETIGTGKNTVVPRHHFVGASAAPPFASYSRPLFQERIGHSFYSGGPPCLASPGLGSSCGPFSSAGSSSETSVFSIPASHRLATPTRLDSTITVCTVRPEWYCNPSNDGFDKLDRLEAAWATRKE